MKTTRNNLIWLFIVILFALISFATGRLYKSERNNRLRIEQAFAASIQEIKYYKSRNGELVAKVNVMQLKYNELKDIYPDIIAEIRNLKIRPGHVDQYSETIIHEQKDIETTLRDSLIYDTIPVRVFNYSDEFYTISGIAVNDTQRVHIESRDSLIQLVYRGDRIKPWLWVFSRRQLQQVLTCKNPNSKIEYSTIIKIKK
ncbi:MAG TPA: DUF6549 family protein [Methanosarcina sp.]|nr:DUF6549 family protein [Methanosarcina sp.]